MSIQFLFVLFQYPALCNDEKRVNFEFLVLCLVSV